MPLSLLNDFLDRPPTAQMLDRLSEFAAWLISEAAAAGGLGPQEEKRLWQRHIFDSAAFARAWPVPPESCMDLGSGAGLPGIVLGILWPTTEVLLIDRSGRRTGLVRRAIRILDLPNVSARQAEISQVSAGQEAAVMRAVLPPPAAIRTFGRLLGPGGRGVLGLSRTAGPNDQLLLQEAERNGLAATIETIKVLDPPAWMLMMSRS
ncbi:MAG: class I SAM-dependent methyltransferase [Acidimicrobiia bacterium]|nr:class I SAM-dependent methyltransferase [Acidimicrobiia bacterium]